MSNILLENGVVYTGTDVIDNGAVLVSGERIAAVGTRDSIRRPPSCEVVDLQGEALLPGLIDRHVHGGGGADTMDATPDAIRLMARALAKFGVTAFCPATMAAPDEQVEAALAAVAAAAEEDTGGADIIGAHLEGPCMSADARGAHLDEYVRATPPSEARFKKYLRAARGRIAVWTIAPELPGAIDLIKMCRTAGIHASIGHTKASIKQIQDAIDAGADGATHIFNAMGGFHYRDAGGVMAILNSRGRLWVEVIADGEHVHPSAIYVALRCVGSERLVLITDGMRPVGAAMDRFELPGLAVVVKDGRALTADGKLCGSLLTMNRALKNVNEMLGIPLPDLIPLATLNVAKSLGIEKDRGSLTVGKFADLVVADSFMTIKQTYVRGRKVAGA